MSLLIMPTTHGYAVEVETKKISKRTGEYLWHEVLLTRNEDEATRKYEELIKDGKTARIYECIY